MTVSNLRDLIERGSLTAPAFLAALADWHRRQVRERRNARILAILDAFAEFGVCAMAIFGAIKWGDSGYALLCVAAMFTYLYWRSLRAKV